MNTSPAWAVDVSIVMPCLNEVRSLPHCIANAKAALAEIMERYSLTGEIVIADNGSTDGSQAVAGELGARTVAIEEKGYGAALRGGFSAARGRFLVMGDCDGSYDFTECVPMIGKLLDGADICMGSRFAGGIRPGAMPWKNRYIGNPLLTGILNLFFRARIGDAHCGLRALTRDSLEALRLSGAGMEFASEMLIKASLRSLRIDEVPVTLSPDLRDRAPHLRPWRDGWRHLRYLLMFSPRWLFGLPGLLALIVGLPLVGAAFVEHVFPGTVPQIGAYWTLLGSALISTGHLCLLLALCSHLYGLLSGFREPDQISYVARRYLNLETMLILGLILLMIGAAILGKVYLDWIERSYRYLPSIFLPAVGCLCLSLGMQNILGGFLLAIIGGNNASFYNHAGVRPSRQS